MEGCSSWAPTVRVGFWSGVDGSENSLRAGSYAAGLARRQCSEAWWPSYVAQRRLGVSAALAATAGVVLPADGDDCADELRRMAHERAAEVGIQVAFVHRSGTPYEEIVAVAAELRRRRHRHRRLALTRDAAWWAHWRHDWCEARWPVTVVP